MLRDAPGFKRAMLDSKHDARARALGSEADAWAGLPDAHAAAAAASSVADAPTGSLAAAAAPVAAAAPAASPMSADEVTRTLASLADLRDRGAISAEEYEAKKADLLEPPLSVVTDAAIGPRGPTDR